MSKKPSKKDGKSGKSKKPKLKVSGKKNPKKDSAKPPKEVELKASAERAVVEAAVIWRVDPTSEVGQQALIDAVDQLPIRSRPQPVPASEAQPAQVDFSTVMISRRMLHQCMQHDMLGISAREVGYLVKTVKSIARTANRVQKQRDGSAEGSAFLASKLGDPDKHGFTDGIIDLATLINVAGNAALQDVVRTSEGRSGFIGEAAVDLLKRFVDKAQEVVCNDARVDARIDAHLAAHPGDTIGGH